MRKKKLSLAEPTQFPFIFILQDPHHSTIASHGQGSPPFSTAERTLTVPGKKRTKRVTSITSDMWIQEGQDEWVFPRVGREVGAQ